MKRGVVGEVVLPLLVAVGDSVVHWPSGDYIPPGKALCSRSAGSAGYR